MELACSNCQKRLRVKPELAGRRAKCPACGASLTVPQPAGSPDTSPPPAESRPPASPGEDDLWQWLENSAAELPVTKPSPRTQVRSEAPAQDPPATTAKATSANATAAKVTAAKKKAKSKKQDRFAFSLFGRDVTLFSMLGTLVVVGLLIGVPLYWFGIFDANFRVADIRRVESYSPYGLGYVGLFGSARCIGGTDRFVILRDHSEGEFLLVRFVMRQSWVNHMRETKVMDVLSLKDQDFSLRVGDTEVHPLLMITELPSEPRAVTYPLAKGTDVTPSAEDRWGGGGKLVSTLEPVFGLDGRLQSCSGTAAYTSANGMQVQFAPSGRAISINWPEGAAAKIGSERFEASGDFFAVNAVLNCLFPRPKQAGPATLSLFGQEVPLTNLP